MAVYKGIHMRCKEAEKLIPLFLKDDLDTDDLREMVEHIDECELCREELTIQFLVQEGLVRLEAGNVFDLQKELKLRMEKTEHTLKMRENLKLFLYGLEGMVAVAFCTLIALILLLK